MAIEKRKIPKSDKAKRSLYMSAQTIKNLPKNKRIEWEGDKTPSGSGDTYTYSQSKKGAVRGSKKRAIRTPYGDDVDLQIDKHMSFPDKKGGSETLRRKVKSKHKTLVGRGTKSSDTDSTIDSSYTKQTRGGKVLRKEQMPETEESKRAIMKEVQEEVVRPKKKKAVKKKPKVKDSTFTGMVARKEDRKLYEEKAKKWKKDKAEGKITSEKIKARIKAENKRKAEAKKENDNKVQADIKSGFGDMLTPSKMKANSKATIEKMKSNREATLGKMKSNREATLAKMKANREATLKKMKANK